MSISKSLSSFNLLRFLRLNVLFSLAILPISKVLLLDNLKILVNLFLDIELSTAVTFTYFIFIRILN